MATDRDETDPVHLLNRCEDLQEKLIVSPEATKELTIACFIDAFGWEVAKDTDFLEGLADHRYRLKSVFGYSNAVIPSILTGVKPAEHGQWSFFYYSPETSPFRGLRILRFLPKFLSGKHRFRNKLSQWFKHRKGYTGYFQLYNAPFEHIHLLDYCEKEDYFVPGGLAGGETIFDRLHAAGVVYHKMWDPISDVDNVAALHREVDAGDIRFAYLHLAELDSALHDAPAGSARTASLISGYESFLRELTARARKTYDRVRLMVFSDHGMAPVKKEIDLIARIEATGLTFGKDYVAFYDSTTARFWFLADGAREKIESALAQVPEGRIVSEKELKELGTLFDGHRYGELIFLFEEGAIIVPSFMGENGIGGMHGYHPDDRDSYAILFASEPMDPEPAAVTDLFRLMLQGVDEKR